MRKLFFAGLLLVVPAALRAQSIGIGTSSPASSAALDVASSNPNTTPQGFLPPRLTKVQREAIDSPAAGLLVYQSDDAPGAAAGLYLYGGSSWSLLPTGSGSADNLGDHTATQNLNLAANKLVGGSAATPGTVGLGLNANGLLTLGPATANASSSDLSGLFIRNSDSGIIATGTAGRLTSTVAVPSGAGTRLMWLPQKMAFRVGNVTGNQWDDANIGNYSFAQGRNAQASGEGSFAAGDRARATGLASFASGTDATASGTASIAMGASCRATGFCSISMGYTNISKGLGSVALGYRATARNDYSVVIGNRATSNGYVGAVVINANAASTDSLEAQANSEFRVRAQGGIALRTNGAGTTGCDLPAGSGVFACTSARGTKNHFRAVNEPLILAQIAALPVLGWQYQTEPGSIRHLGPFAGDFRRAFGLGTDSLSIGLQDMDGVLFVGLKELARQHVALAKQNSSLQADNEALRTRLARLEQQVQQLVTAPAPTSRPRRWWARQPQPADQLATPTLAAAAGQ